LPESLVSAVKRCINTVALINEQQADQRCLAAFLRVFYRRVYREAVGHVPDKKTIELLDHLNKYPESRNYVCPGRARPWFGRSHLFAAAREFRIFSIISTVGLPQDITAQEFRIECMFRQSHERAGFVGMSIGKR